MADKPVPCCGTVCLPTKGEGMKVKEIQHNGVVFASDIAQAFDEGKVKWVRIGGDVLEVLYVWVSSDKTEVTLEGELLDAKWGYEESGEREYTFPARTALTAVTVVERDAKNWAECLPHAVVNGSEPYSEEVVWQAIADFHDVDVSEIADGDLVEYL